ncbi:MAG TPA: carotenoid oxygenase family protein [Spirillospora sp.]|nr:carotenoid oxygenase family protein [Spirillospora sp.]
MAAADAPARAQDRTCGRLDQHHADLAGVVASDDVALTTRHMVFVLDPYLFDLRAVLGGAPLFDAIRHRPEKGTRFVLVPRHGGPARIVEHPALVHVHVANAFEDGPDTVVDLVLFDDFATVKRDLAEFRTRFTALPASRLTRCRITPSGRVIETPLSDLSGEFPQYDQRLATRPHRYSHLAGRTGPHGEYDSIPKIDNDGGRSWAHGFGTGTYVGEPIFVPPRTPPRTTDGCSPSSTSPPSTGRSSPSWTPATSTARPSPPAPAAPPAARLPRHLHPPHRRPRRAHPAPRPPARPLTSRA